MDYCRKEEIKKLKINSKNNINKVSQNSVFRNYIKINKGIKMNNINRNIFLRNKSLMNYFNNNSDIICNYNQLIKKEFPAINSYFHKYEQRI